MFSSVVLIALSDAVQQIEDNWRTGQCRMQRIQCRSEASKGVYCLQYDDQKIVSGLRDNTIKVMFCLVCLNFYLLAFQYDSYEAVLQTVLRFELFEQCLAAEHFVSMEQFATSYYWHCLITLSFHASSRDVFIQSFHHFSHCLRTSLVICYDMRHVTNSLID